MKLFCEIIFQVFFGGFPKDVCQQREMMEDYDEDNMGRCNTVTTIAALVVG